MTFAASLEPALLRDLFRKMVGEMRLAGDLGTLLRVEDGIATELTQRSRAVRQEAGGDDSCRGWSPLRRQGELDLSGIEDDAVFPGGRESESSMHCGALRSPQPDAPACGAGSLRATQRRASRLLSSCGREFDVVLMNPPFGAGSLAAKKEFEKSYPRTKNDVYAAFVERGIQLLHPARDARRHHIAYRLLPLELPEVARRDPAQGSAACCVRGSRLRRTRQRHGRGRGLLLREGPRGAGVKTVFLRALQAEDKATALRAAIREPELARGRQRFEVEPATFEAVPRSPFAYWVSDQLRQLFKELPRFEGDGRTAKQGLATADDFRWLRLWWESGSEQPDDDFLVPFVKGGTFSPFYAAVPLAIRWGQNGRSIKAWKADQLRQGRITANNSKCWNESYYFRPGLTWPLRGIRFSAQAVPQGCIFSVAGKMAFGQTHDLTLFLSLFNSQTFDKFIAFFAGKVGGVQYKVGLIQSLPLANLSDDEKATLTTLARRAWSLKRRLDGRIESSHAFVLPALLQVEGDTIAKRAIKWADHIQSIEADLLATQAEIDMRCFDIYGIGDADRRAISEGFGGDKEMFEGPADSDDDADAEVDQTGEIETAADAATLADELVSWCVAVAFGRFDARFATGARPIPGEPEPFDPLPRVSTATLCGGDHPPLGSAPAEYPFVFPKCGVLVDDPGHPRDLTAAVRAVFEAVFGVSADALWNEAAALLDPRTHDLRAWLASSFFQHHLKRHSKSRRKAPIFWQLGTSFGAVQRLALCTSAHA